MRLIFAKCLVISIFMLVMAGCAATSTTVMDEEAVFNQKPMSSYKSLIIREFELKRELYTDLPASKTDSRERRYAQIPAQLAENILRYVKSKHIYEDVSTDGAATAPPSY